MRDNAHIREFLAYYCELQKDPQYAVLLTGLWGSGKTWFIKDFIEKHLPQPEKALYLSLYGVQSLDDIESEFFRLLHPLLGSKPARILGRLFRGILKTSINFDLDGDGKSDGSISGGIPAEKLLERTSLDRDRILVLDDLERCSIPISDLLGYANQFVEHSGIKTILIANEAEIISDDSDSAPRYARIKEKLIGRTFEVIPEVASALDHFASELPTGEAQDIVRANFRLITQVYECSKYKNLRLVRHALWDFDRLLRAVEPAAKKSDALLTDLLALFLSYSFETRSGAIKPSQINKLRDNWPLHSYQDSERPDPDQRFHEIRKKYSGLQLYSSLIRDSVWSAIFSTGSVPASELNEALLNSKYFQNENQPNWVKLWYGTNLSDEDFAIVLAQAETEWHSRTHRNLGEVVHVAGLFVKFADFGILNKSVEEVLYSAKSYVDHLIETGAIPIIKANLRLSPFERDAYAGLGFSSLDNELFQEFLTYIDEKRQLAAEENIPSQANALLELIGSDTNLFFRRIILNNDPENTYYEIPIMHHIQPKDFVNRLLEANPKDRELVAYALKERYSFQQFNTKLSTELPWLRGVEAILHNEILNRTGKISSLSLSRILNTLTSAIMQIEAANSTALKE